MEYSKLTDKEKKKFIKDNYIKKKLSFAEIAKIGEPENEWDSTQRGTVFVKSSSA